MDFDAFDRARKILMLYLATDPVTPELRAQFEGWLLDRKDSEEVEVALYLLFEELTEGEPEKLRKIIPAKVS